MDSHSESEVWAIWQNQSGDDQPIRLDDIRTRADRLTARALRWRLISMPLFVLILIVEAWQVWTGREMVERAGDLLTMAALMYAAYRFRKHHSAVSPALLGETGCVAFYRAELIRQRDLSRDTRGYVLPFVPGVALSLVGGVWNRPVSYAILVIAFGVATFVGVAWWNAHTTRKLQAEIDALLDSSP